MTTQKRPLRIAIVGAGPAGFYTAECLFKTDLSVKVDMFEKLPAPFGLVRYGVAPDHEKIKNVIKVFEQTANDQRFSYFGNVTIGRDVSVIELKKFYDAVIFCHGAEADRRLGIKGEDLKGCYTASQFIGWYNGHPRFRDFQFDFSHEVAVIMGQGNVAMDIARILCSTREELAKTDICKHALDVLSESKIKKVHVYGRNSALHASFTPKEIKEMGELADCCPFVDRQDLDIDSSVYQEFEGPSNAFRIKNLEILRSFTNFSCGSQTRRFILHFNRKPVEIVGTLKMQKIVFEILHGGKSTGEYEEIDSGVFFTSIGYMGEPMDGLPFLSTKGIVPNLLGRVLEEQTVKRGLYVCGWIANGASGVIGTNKQRAQETVHSLIEDLAVLSECEYPDTEKLLNMLKAKGIVTVNFIDWKKIDAYEIMLGLNSGKPREKLTNISQMISIAGGSK